MTTTARSHPAALKTPLKPQVVERYIKALTATYAAGSTAAKPKAVADKGTGRKSPRQKQLDRQRNLFAAFSRREFKAYVASCRSHGWAPGPSLVQHVLNLPAAKLRTLLEKVVQERLTHDEATFHAQKQGLLRRRNTKAGRKPHLPAQPDAALIVLRKGASSYCRLYDAYHDRFGSPKGPASGSLTKAYKLLKQAVATLDVIPSPQSLRPL